MGRHGRPEKKMLLPSGVLEPPHSLDAEQAVLGAVLKNPDVIDTVLEVVEGSRHFYYPKHQIIFDSMLSLYRCNTPLDIVTVANDLLNQGLLEKIGNRVYLVDLMEQVASTANVCEYARIVLEKSALRRLINTSNEIVKSAYAQDLQSDKLVAQALEHVFALLSGRDQMGAVTAQQMVPIVLEHIESIQGGNLTAMGVSTGFPDIDRLIFGLGRRQLIVIGGQSGHGKTTLAMAIAEHIAIDLGLRVGIISLEMPAEELTEKLMLSQAGLSSDQVRSGQLTPDQWQSLTAAANRIATDRIVMVPMARLTPQIMHTQGRLLVKARNCDVLIIDHLHLMCSDDARSEREQELSAIAFAAKSLAMELDVPVLLLAQLNRMSGREKRRPELFDLKGSSGIEQAADKVLFVYRPDIGKIEQEATAEIIVAKHRNGPAGMTWLQWQAGKFRNLDLSTLREKQEQERARLNREQGGRGGKSTSRGKRISVQ